jgi:hypothetical protein
MSFWLNVRRNNPEPLMSESGQTRSFRGVGSMSGLPEGGHCSAIYEEHALTHRHESRFRSRGLKLNPIQPRIA